jgi:hypothetical protein
LILPACNSEAMNLYLAEIANTVGPDSRAVLLVDQVGWHPSARPMVSRQYHHYPAAVEMIGTQSSKISDGIIMATADWQGRFSSVVLDEEHLLEAARYVALNPVRACMAAHTQDWPWRACASRRPRRRMGACRPLLDRVGRFTDLIVPGAEPEAFAALRVARGHRTARRLRCIPCEIRASPRSSGSPAETWTQTGGARQRNATGQALEGTAEAAGAGAIMRVVRESRCARRSSSPHQEETGDRMATVFFSYSHKDESLRDQLETHLSMLKRQGFIETWHDRRITAGAVFGDAISANVERADIVLLLVSPDFLASEYCYEKEMMRALERHQAGECTVVPVILRPCDWYDAPFGKLLAAPKDDRPITQWPDIDEAFLDVTKKIKGALSARGMTHPASPPTSPKPSPSVVAAPAPPEIRSSNLRVTKRFTDQDKDHFLQEAFEFMAKYFENSLAELSKRNPGIDGRFRQIDANRFTAVAYRNGEAIARCGIRLGHRTGILSGITYSHNESADNGSFNESLSVEHDDQALYLKSLGMSTMRSGGREEKKLSMEGGAELYWELFIEPLQRG